MVFMWTVAAVYGWHFWTNWRDGVAETLVRHPYLNNEVRAYYSDGVRRISRSTWVSKQSSRLYMPVLPPR